jgi:hypothetical protein
MKVLLPAPVAPITGMMMSEGDRFRVNAILNPMLRVLQFQGNEILVLGLATTWIEGSIVYLAYRAF